MRRLLRAMHTDVVLQARNQLYTISMVVSVVIAGVLAMVSHADNLAQTFPMAALLIAGGSTLLYVTGMIMIERADGTLAALSVSPLRPAEYLGAKVATLTGIALLEGAVILVGAWWWLQRDGVVEGPNVALGVLAMACLGAAHVLAGVIVVVRYRGFMDALMPMAIVAVVMQLPAFYFVGAVNHWAMLMIPTGAPTMLLRGAFVPLQTWEWAYGLTGTVSLLVALWTGALRAFDVHVIQKAG